MAILEGAVNTTINGGTFIAGGSNTKGGLKFSASDDIVNILHFRSATAGLLDAAERFDAPKCDEGTRVSMLRGMRNFVQEGGPSSSPAIYWLHGPAGVGKSALAQSLAFLLKDEGNHAASFFFSRTSPGRNDGNQLIVTLAYQLAINFPALQPFILKTFKKNPAILTASNTVKMQSLIVDPINGWQKKYKRSVRRWAHKLLNPDTKLHPRLILVDGLDECNVPQVQRDLILCIALAVRQLSLPFRFVIASRPESHIMATFELDSIFQGPHGVKFLTKNLGDDEDADEQVTTFLLKEFAEIRRTHPVREFLPQPWPIPGQIAQLVSKSSKGFIYPATVIRYIKMPNNRPDECLKRILGLSEIPIRDKPYEPLDILYRYIFESVPDVNKDAIRDIFHFLVVPSNLPDCLTTPRLIEEYFNYKPGHVQHVLRDLLCLVTVTSIDHPIEVLHASLPDFLLDRSRSGPLCIDIGDAHATIAASFALFTSHRTELTPHPDFVEVLGHIMQANLSNTLVHRRLVNLDFSPQYMTICGRWSSYMRQLTRNKYRSLMMPETYLEGIAFMVAYLLVLVIKNAQQIDIRKQIAKMRTYILQEYSFAAFLHAVRDELGPAMIPFISNWRSGTVYHKYINYVFAFEVPPSQYEIREDIFELHFLMMAPLFSFFKGNKGKYKGYSEAIDQSHHSRLEQPTSCSNHISHALLYFMMRDHQWNTTSSGLMVLAADLLGVSLAHADYSEDLVLLLGLFLNARLAGITMLNSSCLLRLALTVSNYFDSAYPNAPVIYHRKIQELHVAWRRYLD